MMYNVHIAGLASRKKISPRGPITCGAFVGVLLKPVLLHDQKFEHTTDELFAASGILPLPDQVHANRL